MSELTGEIGARLRKFAAEPSSEGLDELWQEIEKLAQRQHPDLTKQQAFVAELKRNPAYDACVKKFETIRKTFHGLA